MPPWPHAPTAPCPHGPSRTPPPPRPLAHAPSPSQAAKESLFKRKLNSATKKVRKQSAHAMAIGAKAGAATARVAGATGRAAVGAAKVGFSLPTRALNDDAPAEEIDLSDEVGATTCSSIRPPRPSLGLSFSWSSLGHLPSPLHGLPSSPSFGRPLVLP